MADDEWGDPDEAMGDRVNPRDIINHLLIVWVVDYIQHSPTKFTQPGKPSDVIVVDVCDLDLADSQGFQGLLSRKVWWRQSRLIASLKAKIGTRMLCRMTQGTGNSGYNAPFELLNMIGDPECRRRGDQWVKAHPNFTPSLPGGRAEFMTDIATRPVAATNVSTVEEKTYLEQLAEQSYRGSQKLGNQPPPMPPPMPPVREEEAPF